MRYGYFKNSQLMMILCAGIFSMSAVAQGISPMQKSGKTASDKKLFRLTIINPYAKDVRYELHAEDKATKTQQADVKFTGRTGHLPPRSQKKVLVLIPVQAGARDVRVCLRFPEMEDAIRARVCSDLTAIAIRSTGSGRRVHATATTGGGW